MDKVLQDLSPNVELIKVVLTPPYNLDITHEDRAYAFATLITSNLMLRLREDLIQVSVVSTILYNIFTTMEGRVHGLEYEILGSFARNLHTLELVDCRTTKDLVWVLMNELMCALSYWDLLLPAETVAYLEAGGFM